MEDLSEQHLGERLLSVEPLPRRRWWQRPAAVAIVLRWQREAPDVLLMRRIERRGDPWSGQVSLPGGGGKAEDASVVETATRETLEEVDLALDQCARLAGRLEPLRPIPRGLRRPMQVIPLVFSMVRPDQPSPGDEAQRVFWFPLDRAHSGELDSTFTFHIGPTSRDFPCWRYDGEVVWGLTHHILRTLMKRVVGDVPRR